MNANRAHDGESPNTNRRGLLSPEGASEIPSRPAAGSDGASAQSALPVEGLAVPEDTRMAPGATPPAESGVSGLGAPEREALRRGWAITPLTLIWTVVLLIAVGLVAMAVVLALT